MKNIFVFALAALISTSAIAGEKKEQGSGPNLFTECGIGAALFPNSNVGAVTSNVIWDAGLTATTSAFSSPEMCNPKKVKTAKLILETLPQLEKDVAKGEGEYINALAETMECGTGFSAELRANYADVVASGEYASNSKIERATNMYNAVKGAVASSSCNITL